MSQKFQSIKNQYLTKEKVVSGHFEFFENRFYILKFSDKTSRSARFTHFQYNHGVEGGALHSGPMQVYIKFGEKFENYWNPIIEIFIKGSKLKIGFTSKNFQIRLAGLLALLTSSLTKGWIEALHPGPLQGARQISRLKVIRLQKK